MATVIYQFNALTNDGSFNTATGLEPALIVDGNDATSGRDNVNAHYCTCTGNACAGTNLGIITAVSLAVLWSSNSTIGNIKGRLTPYFGGSSAGNNHDCTVAKAEGSQDWTEEFNITTDTNAPTAWGWVDVQNLDCRLTTVRGSTGRWNPFAVRITVTYSIRPTMNWT